jgi:biotin--protein ligase
VTLTTTTPERKVRISGITNDYGLLRTIPEKSGNWVGGKDEEFIDLQPDGNSFDIMSGLIKSKT